MTCLWIVFIVWISWWQKWIVPTPSCHFLKIPGKRNHLQMGDSLLAHTYACFIFISFFTVENLLLKTFFILFNCVRLHYAIARMSVSSQSSVFEILTHLVMALGSGAFGKVNDQVMRTEPSWKRSVPQQKKPGRAALSICHVRTQQKDVFCKPERELSLDTKSSGVLIWTSQPL